MQPNQAKRFFSIFFLLAAGALVLFGAYRLLAEKSGRIAGRFFRPYLAFENLAEESVADRTLLLRSKEELARELAAVRRENRKLALDLVQVENLRRENRQLRQLGHLQDAPGWLRIPAEIILRDPLFWKTQFTINQGASAGIRRGDAVVDVQSNGAVLLVGVVNEVDEFSARVYTVFHPAFRFSFRLKKSGGIGFVNASDRGAGQGMLPVEYLSATTEIEPGEEMLTTGFELQLPAGIRIGMLQHLDTVDPLYFAEKRHTGAALPSIIIDRLHFVVVLSRRELYLCRHCGNIQQEGDPLCRKCGAPLRGGNVFP